MRVLRIGLMVNDFMQPAWVAGILDELQSCSFAEVALVIRRKPEPEESKSALRKIVERRRELAYHLYTRLDRKLFRVSPDASEYVDITPRLAKCPVVEVAPIRKTFSERFPPEDVQAIESCDLDVILRWGFGILRGSVLRAARYGVWSFHHGDPDAYRGGPPGFWEVMEANPVTGVMLQQLTEELDNGVLLQRGAYRTDPWSVNRNVNRYYWKSSSFVMRSLERLAQSGELPRIERPYIPYQSRLYKTPSNWQTCRGVAALAGRYATHKLTSRFRQPQWAIGYSLTNSFPDTFYRFKALEPPRDCFWADPFPLLHEGRHYIFIEELPYRRNLGHLSIIPLLPDGSAGEPIKILEKPYHLSYPQVFRWKGDLFLMPETGRNRTLEVYRCRSFPDVWEPHTTVMRDVGIVDATLHEMDGQWWLFAGMTPRKGFSTNDEELHLFWADSPFGPWKPHAANPVKVDIRSSRPAGWPFRYRGALYRPAQDSSGAGALSETVVHRVDVLNRSEYRETEVARLRGGWGKGQLGTHTLNYADGLAVIDVLRYRPPF